MVQIKRELLFYLFSLRWILLIVSFLFYIDTYSESLVVIFLLCMFNIMNIIAILKNISRKIMGIFIGFDLVFNIILLSFTGHVESPFMIYTTTTLFWLAIVSNVKVVITISMLYFSTLALTFYYTFQAMVYTPIYAKLFATVVVLTLIHFFFFIIKNLYYNCLLVYETLKGISEQNETNFISPLEKLLANFFRTDKVFILTEKSIAGVEEKWEKYYFFKSYKELYPHQENSHLVDIKNIAGIEENYIAYPIVENKISFATILISNEEIFLCKRLNYIYIKLIAVFILKELKQLDLRENLQASMQEKVRTKMAQDMHDGVAQQLFFLSAQMFQLKNTLPDESSKQLNSLVANLESQLKECHLEVRSFIKQLRNEGQDSTNLFEAIDKLVNRLTRGTQIKVLLETNGFFKNEAVEIEEVVYRFVQETASNAVKHSQTSRLEIFIEVTLLQWNIRVRDYGIGIREDTPSKSIASFGLVGLKERIEAVNGHLTIQSQIDKGTELVAIIPRERSH